MENGNGYATAWCCTDCNFLYTVASDTLMYPIGGKEYKNLITENAQIVT